MKPEVSFETDKSGGRNVFDQFASEIERAKLQGEQQPEFEKLLEKLAEIEISIQRLSDANAGALTLRYILNRVKDMLLCWMWLFTEGRDVPEISGMLNIELTNIITYLHSELIKRVTFETIDKDFSSIFMLSLDNIRLIENEGKIINRENNQEHEKRILQRVFKDLQVRVIGRRSLKLREALTTGSEAEMVLEDGEDVMYLWSFELWIDTDDAVKANKFMNLVSSILGYVEDVDIILEDAKVGSFVQRWLVKMKKWSTKEEVKEILDKSVGAAKAYAFDRHTEPIEKSKIERKKTEEEVERMMPTALVEEMHQLTVEEKRLDIEAKKLANLKQRLEIGEKVTDMMVRGLVEIDSDFNVMVNGMLLIKQERGKIEIGDIKAIDENGGKEKIEEGK